MGYYIQGPAKGKAQFIVDKYNGVKANKRQAEKMFSQSLLSFYVIGWMVFKRTLGFLSTESRMRVLPMTIYTKVSKKTIFIKKPQLRFFKKEQPKVRCEHCFQIVSSVERVTSLEHLHSRNVCKECKEFLKVESNWYKLQKPIFL